VIGLCTGLLASAAVASSRSIGELIPLAVEAVVIALRLGLCAYKVRDYVGQYGGQSQSWSAVIPGVSEEKALAIIAEFSNKKVCPIKVLPTHLLLTVLGSFSFISTLR
jgi:naphtho-gamma-pyrone polyketide synthase